MYILCLYELVFLSSSNENQSSFRFFWFWKHSRMHCGTILIYLFTYLFLPKFCFEKSVLFCVVFFFLVDFCVVRGKSIYKNLEEVSNAPFNRHHAFLWTESVLRPWVQMRGVWGVLLLSALGPILISEGGEKKSNCPCIFLYKLIIQYFS